MFKSCHYLYEQEKSYSNLIFMKQFLFAPRGNLINYIYCISDMRLICKMLLSRNQQFQQKLLRINFFVESNKNVFLCWNENKLYAKSNSFYILWNFEGLYNISFFWFFFDSTLFQAKHSIAELFSKALDTSLVCVCFLES